MDIRRSGAIAFAHHVDLRVLVLQLAQWRNQWPLL